MASTLLGITAACTLPGSRQAEAQERSGGGGGYVVQAPGGRAAVYVGGGRGVGVVGTTGSAGFDGVVVGPDGKVRTIRPDEGRRGRSQRSQGSGVVVGQFPAEGGVFVGAGDGGFTATPMTGFDPFLFAFGPSRSPFGAEAGFTPETRVRSGDLSAAARAFRRGDYRDALRQLDTLDAIYPGDPATGQARALALFALGEHRASGAEILASLDRSDSRWGWDVIRRFYQDPNTYAEHYQALRRAADDQAGQAEVQVLLGYHDLVLGRLEEARQAFEDAQGARPGDPIIRDLLGALPPTSAVESDADR